jgi:hypothetical protein
MHALEHLLAVLDEIEDALDDHDDTLELLDALEDYGAGPGQGATTVSAAVSRRVRPEDVTAS